MLNFQLYNKKIPIKDTSKAVQSVEVKLVADNLKRGQVNITDIMLQGGAISTNWTYHPSEIRWSHDG
jgi:hypothetical protein